MIEDWHYYNGGLLPTCNQDEVANTDALKNKSFWKKSTWGTKPILARWTSDYDCDESEWWWVTKDGPFDITALKAKPRYYVKMGEKNFDVAIIDPKEYVDEIYNVQVKAFSAYPEKYRPTVEKTNIEKQVKEWCGGGVLIFGAFNKENKTLCGYTSISQTGKCIGLQSQKTMPEYEKLQVNAALVYAVLNYYKEALSGGYYITNGERNILHETNFDDYLEKYFGFRKVYCKLNIVYNPKYKPIVKMLYPFRKLLAKFDGIGFIHKINGVMKMEEIVRRQKKNIGKGKEVSTINEIIR